MSYVTLTICDSCGVEQRSDANIAWDARITEVTWHIPPDGTNGGNGKVLLCCPCRTRIHAAIERAFKALS